MVFYLETFEHITNIRQLINEIYRILKINGEIIYLIPIEVGFTLILRYLITELIKFKVDDSYNLKELFLNGVLKKLLKKDIIFIVIKNSIIHIRNLIDSSSAFN